MTRRKICRCYPIIYYLHNLDFIQALIAFPCSVSFESPNFGSMMGAMWISFLATTEVKFELPSA